MLRVFIYFRLPVLSEFGSVKYFAENKNIITRCDIITRRPLRYVCCLIVVLYFVFT
jgi:hypothetical protein